MPKFRSPLERERYALDVMASLGEDWNSWYLQTKGIWPATLRRMIRLGLAHSYEGEDGMTMYGLTDQGFAKAFNR